MLLLLLAAHACTRNAQCAALDSDIIPNDITTKRTKWPRKASYDLPTYPLLCSKLVLVSKAMSRARQVKHKFLSVVSGCIRSKNVRSMPSSDKFQADAQVPSQAGHSPARLWYQDRVLLGDILAFGDQVGYEGRRAFGSDPPSSGATGCSARWEGLS